MRQVIIKVRCKPGNGEVRDTGAKRKENEEKNRASRDCCRGGSGDGCVLTITIFPSILTLNFKDKLKGKLAML